MRFAETIVHLVRNDLAETRRLTVFLKSKGISVVTFRTAAEYIKAGRDDRPTCLIPDLILPDTPGLEIQRSLCMTRRAEKGSALADGALKQSFCKRRCHQRTNRK
jgi:FixJ family two-component response regulator